ncbi:hypothetical protein [Citrobacter freundii]|uniref:Uncharacterized protein n=1 Tax=Citrobacter freundii TaxID=546 RepID=A0A7G2II05_CITFR|nr:hypothetical protein [Citrobacter freundii]
MRRQADDRIKADCKCTEFHVIKKRCLREAQTGETLTNAGSENVTITGNNQHIAPQEE